VCVCVYVSMITFIFVKLFRAI